MTPTTDYITRTEFEDRMSRIATAMRAEFDTIRAENRAMNEHQDEEWNKGFRALRDDQTAGFQQFRDDLRNFVTQEVFIARLSPVQSVAYGMVGILVALMTGLLGASLWLRGK